MAPLTVLRAFAGPDGEYGNPLGVFVDGAAVPAKARQRVAADLGFSETVYVDDAERGVVAIFTPAAELPFAGHPLVGTSWLLRRLGTPVDVLRPAAGEVPTWQDDDDGVWIRGRAEWAPDMDIVQLPSVAAVDAADPTAYDSGFVNVWAWDDEHGEIVRSRVFAPAVGIAEDEATGAAAVRLVTHLGRPIEIRQGRGSLIVARPGPDGTAEVGGRCVLDEQRDYDV